jgi:hypothetical protein
VQPAIEHTLAEVDTPQNRMILWAVLGAMLLAVVVYTVRALRRRAAARRLHQGIINTGIEHLQNVLVPDGMGGGLHVDYLLLTSRGVVVVDLRDIHGNVFGGDQMTQWTVMDGATRATFQNPQHALYDRVAAVRAVAGELPVEGRVLFTRRSKFPKGLPRWTLMVDSLRTEFPPVDSEAGRAVVERHRQDWEALRSAVSPSFLRQRRGFFSEVFTEGY